MGVLRDNLQPTDFADAECMVSDWKEHPYYGFSHVRVWLCKCGGHWFQRHEWAKYNQNSTDLDEWIYSGFSISRRMPNSMKINGLNLLKEMAA